MVLSIKKIAIITFALFVLVFIALWFLPESITGHREDNLLLFVPKLLFLAVTAAIGIAFILILLFRRSYVKAQVETFNRFKYYLMLLIKRDFVTKYRKSILGVLWSFLNPLLTMIVMTLVFSYLFRFDIENFPVYLFSGLMIFNFFKESTTLAMSSVIVNEGVIKKIYIPKYMFPLSRVISSLVNLSFSIVCFIFVIIFTGAPIYWTIIMIPIPILFVFVFSLGVGMLLSALAVFFRDLTYLYEVFTLLLMYFTPIFWPVIMLDPEGMLVNIIGLNPLFQFIFYFRDLALSGVIPDLWTTMVCVGYSLLAFCGGTFVFMKQQDKYILSL